MIPVIAAGSGIGRQFSVHTVQTTFAYGGRRGAGHQEPDASRFFWKYDHYDSANHRFVYGAYGAIGAAATLTMSDCNGTGSVGRPRQRMALPGHRVRHRLRGDPLMTAALRQSPNRRSTCRWSAPKARHRRSNSGRLDLSTYKRGFGPVEHARRRAKAERQDGTQPPDLPTAGRSPPTFRSGPARSARPRRAGSAGRWSYRRDRGRRRSECAARHDQRWAPTLATGLSTKISTGA